ncbi:MAG: 50S ribosomal protein L21 [Firmicutes bacterium]|jgi:large subunit ribosomal protein L21|nr:50S ribosomal protein L21 [Bacillota bacterium]
MYAVIETGGKQYRVEPGDVIQVEKLPQEPEEAVEFNQVLLVSDDNGIKIGTPIVVGAKVTATVLEQGKAAKIRGMKYRSKTNYRRRYGHRQPYTKVQIQEILA